MIHSTPHSIAGTEQYSYTTKKNKAQKAMDPHFVGANSLSGTVGDSRALLANFGNYSLTFVPLISLMATILPRIVSRIKTIRPMRTTSGRASPNANLYEKKSLDIHFCTSMEVLEANIFPGFDDLFYICKPQEEKKNNCNIIQEYLEDESSLTEKMTIGKIIGTNDCFYLQLYKCSEGFQFDPEKRKCVTKKS